MKTSVSDVIIMAKNGKLNLNAKKQNGEKMKKTVKILIFLCLIFACLSLKVSANSSDGEYSISYDGERYVMHNSGEDN